MRLTRFTTLLAALVAVAIAAVMGTMLAPTGWQLLPLGAGLVAALALTLVFLASRTREAYRE